MRRREFLGLLGGAAFLDAQRAVTQTLKTYRVDFLSLDPAEDASAIVGRLRELGYSEGSNLTFTEHSAQGDPKRLRSLADAIVAEKPDVIVTGWGTLAPKAAKEATSTIPIVFSTVGDAVGAGLVQTLARPGGNVTGFTGLSTDLKGKQLQILKEIVPGQQAVGVLLNPDTPYSRLALEQLRAAAAVDGTRIEVLEVRSPDEFSTNRMDELVAGGARSLFVLEDPLTNSIRGRVIDLARTLRLPTMAGTTEYALVGALLSYVSDRKYRQRRTADYVDKILKGAKPGDLPVEQPTHFRLLLNLRTAREMGLTIPPTLLARADEVIE